MLEPYEVLLGPYKNHPILGPYLQDDLPAFTYLYPVLDMVDAEERVMVKVAFALHQEVQGAGVKDLLNISDIAFERVVQALRLQRR